MIASVIKGLAHTLTWTFVLLGVLLAANTLTYLNFDPRFGFLRLKTEAVASGWYLPFYYSHVLTGGLILVAGFVQFNTSIRKKWPILHRAFGYLYVIGILLFAAPGGMIMSFFIDRGPLVALSFVVQCSAWIYCTYIAYAAARAKNFRSHEEWMTRSFALTLAAVTLRIYIFIASWWTDLNQPMAYATLAWLSWTPNLLAAELIIRKKITWPFQLRKELTIRSRTS